MNYFLRISFRGSDFYGTQKLKNHPTVQKLLEETLSGIFNQKITIKIGSRLDRGVSALDLGANFKVTKSTIRPEKLTYVLNRLLPPYIRINETRLVPEDFNARYDATRKTYLYIIEMGKPNPLLVDMVYHPIFKFDLELLEKATKLFKGDHCFDYFGSEESKEGKVYRIDDVTLETRGEYVLIRITGRSFMRYQIRFMVGTAYEVAANRLDISEITKRLDGTLKVTAHHKAPANGLILEKVEYDFERSEKDA